MGGGGGVDGRRRRVVVVVVLLEVEGATALGVELVGFQRRAAEKRGTGRCEEEELAAAATAPRVRKGDCLK
jgi:hypothetical protein